MHCSSSCCSACGDAALASTKTRCSPPTASMLQGVNFRQVCLFEGAGMHVQGRRGTHLPIIGSLFNQAADCTVRSARTKEAV